MHLGVCSAENARVVAPLPRPRDPVSIPHDVENRGVAIGIDEELSAQVSSLFPPPPQVTGSPRSTSQGGDTGSNPVGTTRKKRKSGALAGLAATERPEDLGQACTRIGSWRPRPTQGGTFVGRVRGHSTDYDSGRVNIIEGVGSRARRLSQGHRRPRTGSRAPGALVAWILKMPLRSRPRTPSRTASPHPARKSWRRP